MMVEVANAPERPSLSKYNRAAQSSLDLFLAPERDFPFIACWTAANRAPTPEEWRGGDCAAGSAQTRLDWLSTLIQQEAVHGRQASLPEEIISRLRASASRPAVMDGWHHTLTQGLARLPLGSFPLRGAQRIAGLSRYTYRHSRKRILRFVQYMGSWASRLFGPNEVVSLAREMAPEEKELFLNLVAARREYLEKQNAVSR